MHFYWVTVYLFIYLFMNLFIYFFFAVIIVLLPHINPSSPKGGCTNPPNGFRPGAQNRTAKG